jgi:hypothetical protein
MGTGKDAQAIVGHYVARGAEPGPRIWLGNDMHGTTMAGAAHAAEIKYTQSRAPGRRPRHC